MATATQIEKKREHIKDDPDQVVEETKEDDDTVTDQPATETPAADPDGKALFDRSQYDDPGLAIAKVDGQQIDKIRLNFSGSIMLDRSDKADVALYNKLILSDSTVTLMVEGECTGTGAKKNTNREGDLDVIVGVKTIKIGTVYVAAAELGMVVPAGTATDDDDGGQELAA